MRVRPKRFYNPYLGGVKSNQEISRLAGPMNPWPLLPRLKRAATQPQELLQRRRHRSRLESCSGQIGSSSAILKPRTWLDLPTKFTIPRHSGRAQEDSSTQPQTILQTMHLGVRCVFPLKPCPVLRQSAPQPSFQAAATLLATCDAKRRIA